MGKALWRSSNGSLSIQQSRGTASHKHEVASPGSLQRATGSAAPAELCAMCAECRTGTSGTRLPSSGDHVSKKDRFAQEPGVPEVMGQSSGPLSVPVGAEVRPAQQSLWLAAETLETRLRVYGTQCIDSVEWRANRSMNAKVLSPSRLTGSVPADAPQAIAAALGSGAGRAARPARERMAFRLHRTPWVTGEGTGVAGRLAASGGA